MGQEKNRFAAAAAAVCVCVRVDGSTVFIRFSRLDLYGHTGVLGSGRSPLMRLRCRPQVHPYIAPQPVRYALRP